jgi:hypothetical protein
MPYDKAQLYEQVAGERVFLKDASSCKLHAPTLQDYGYIDIDLLTRIARASPIFNLCQ